jgi:hypothetical protein
MHISFQVDYKTIDVNWSCMHVIDVKNLFVFMCISFQADYKTIGVN